MSDCLFCKIRDGEIPAEKVYENEDVIAFSDVNPQAPMHILIVPRKHIATVNELDDGDDVLMGKLMIAARDIARSNSIAEDGYRLVVNCKEKAGQTVFHIHMHMLAGRQMTWPPG